MTRGSAARPASREAKVAAQRRAAQAKVRRRRALRIGAVAVLALAVIGIGVAVQVHRGNTAATSGNGSPAGTTGPQHSVFVAPATSTTSPTSTITGSTKPTQRTAVPVDLYEDFQCPACRDFESAVGATLKELVADGAITLRYHPIAFLDRASTTKYSTRALNAAGCVMNRAPAAFPAFHEVLFARQPEEGSAGLDDATLVSLAAQAGAPGLGECVRERTFEGWTVRVTDQASKERVNGTPTVRVAGKELSARTAAALRAAVRAAQS